MVVECGTGPPDPEVGRTGPGSRAGATPGRCGVGRAASERGDHRMSRISRRRRLLAGSVAATLLATLVPTIALADHPEASLAGSNFEIDVDANLKLDDASPSVDWKGLLHALPTDPEKRALDAPTGRDDDSYVGGSKENTNCPDETTGSIPNNKSDLLSFHVYTEPGTGAHPGYLNLAWSRVSDPSGTTLMDFEFNAGSPTVAADVCAEGPNVKRTEGDLLIEYAIDQGGAQANMTLREWTGSAWGPADPITTPSETCNDGTEDQPCAAGTINSDPIPAADSDGLISEGAMQARTFGEAQIDLRTIFEPNKCRTLGSAMLKSRSSDSFTSQLKDFIEPKSINLTNCGTVIVRKATDPVDNSTSFGFTKSFGTDPSSPNTFNLTGQTANDANVKTFNNVLFGTGYTIDETTVPSGWTFVSVDCSASSGVTPSSTVDSLVTFAIDASTDVLDCTYTNRARGSLTITKKDDDDPQALLQGAGFTLYTDVDPTDGDTAHDPNEDTATALTCSTGADGTCTISDIPLGQYWIVETTTPTGYSPAPDEALTVTAGSSITKTLVDKRRFKVITLVCQNSDDSLYPSTVKLDKEGSGEDTDTSLSQAELNAFNTANSTSITAAQLCALTGAVFSPRHYGSYDGNVTIPQ